MGHTAWVTCQGYAREILSREKYVVDKNGEMEFKLTSAIYKILLENKAPQVLGDNNDRRPT